MSRRGFLTLGVRLWGAAIALIFAVPVVGYVVSPLLRGSPRVWRRAGFVGDLAYLEPRKFTVLFPPENSWAAQEVPFAVYAVRLPGGRVKALANICTHMQCPVRWDPPRGAFLCPCHGGLYTADGTNIGGPPPKPLSQWVHRIDADGVLYVQNRLTEAI
ncbi:MAG: ubiquinol-cytochrome c reductase iron-sulfur subunit [Candidatus Dormibacterales bacterium]